MYRVLQISLAALAALCCGTQAQAGLITNGTFTSAGQASLAGWSSTAGVNASTESGYGGCCGATNTRPNNLAAFGSGQTSGGLLSQTFATVAGQTYTLSFLYGTFGDNEPQSLAVSVGSLSTTVTDPTGTSDFSTLFNTETFTFTALASTSTLAFHDTSVVGSSADGMLENVVATAATTVSEPVSLALFGLGVASVFGLRARKGSKPFFFEKSALG